MENQPILIGSEEMPPKELNSENTEGTEPGESLDADNMEQLEGLEENNCVTGEDKGELLEELQLEREKHDEQMKLEVRAREVTSGVGS